ncbi:hypothetical protein [Acinetobacter bereziniae]|uniref:hypothetical protein n=1 Tax=Acinetobacter bereziniae TaxID=106648 RepID=UPI0018DCCB5B|nr:hypothetical protein [Acinetobacter bereziniae]MBI0393490.1 hypothetical protein [Acinetobacter bereziniae]
MSRQELESRLYEEEMLLEQQERNRTDLRNATILTQARRKQRSEDTLVKILIGTYFIRLLNNDIEFLRSHKSSILLEYRERNNNYLLLRNFLEKNNP